MGGVQGGPPVLQGKTPVGVPPPHLKKRGFRGKSRFPQKLCFSPKKTQFSPRGGNPLPLGGTPLNPIKGGTPPATPPDHAAPA